MARLLAVLTAALVLIAPLGFTGDPASAAAAEPRSGAQAKPVSKKYAETIGTSWKGRKIVAYFRGDPKAAHQVVLIGQIHGNEPAGRQVADHVRNKLNPKPGTGLWIIPTMNPDGAAAGTRLNARRVDLNRNLPTNGWRGTRSSCCWGGTAAGSERETKAIVTFLNRVKPDYVVALHQPYGVIAENGKDRAFEKRLAKALGLPIDPVSIGGPNSTVAPSLTSWFNAKHGKHGTSVTVELKRTTTSSYRTKAAAPGLMRAMLVRS